MPTLTLPDQPTTALPLLPGTPGYEEVRRVWNAAVDVEPVLIVRPTTADEVATALLLARAQRRPIALRSGGHSPAGLGTIDGGVVIDLSGMKAIEIDPFTRRVRLEPGLTWGEVAAALHEYGLAITSGDVADVGVGGLTQGGGIGWFVRHYGLAIDRLRAVELVTAEGEQVRASEDEHAELFWAVRGAGANFGVITALEFEAHPGGHVYGGALFFDGQNAAQLLSAYARLALVAPDALTTQAVLMAAPPAPFIPPHLVGRPVVAVMGCWSGELTDAEAALAPFRALATPVADLLGVLPYPALFEMSAEGARRGLGHATRSGFFSVLPDHALAALVDEATRGMNPGQLVQLRVLGGQMGRVAAAETAFNHRNQPYLLMIDQASSDPLEMTSAWNHVERLWSRVSASSEGLYGNFAGERDAGMAAQAYHPQVLERLQALKRRFDPHNVFARNLNISPR